MQKYKTLNQTNLRWYYMILFSLDLLKKTNKKEIQKKINNLDAEKIISVTNSLNINRIVLSIIESYRSLRKINSADYSLIEIIESESKNDFDDLQVLNHKDRFTSVLDSDFLIGIESILLMF